MRGTNKAVEARGVWRRSYIRQSTGATELRAQGVVRAIGVGTTTDTWEMLAPFAQDGGSDCFLVVNRYTLIDHSALEQFLPLCLERRIGVVVGGPYYSGILATDLTPRAVFDLFLQHRPADAEILRILHNSH